jgi:hypothetical protein
MSGPRPTSSSRDEKGGSSSHTRIFIRGIAACFIARRARSDYDDACLTLEAAGAQVRSLARTSVWMNILSCHGHVDDKSLDPSHPGTAKSPASEPIFSSVMACDACLAGAVAFRRCR